MAQYTPEWNADLADEIDARPEHYTSIPTAIADYTKLRDRIRRWERESEKLNG